METFEEYLESKKIDSDAFSLGDNLRWKEFQFLFDQMHPKSLTAQKLFLINEIRRKYPLKLEAEKKEVKKATARPVMKPKPKNLSSGEGAESTAIKKGQVKPKIVVKPRVVVKPKNSDAKEQAEVSADEKNKIKPKVTAKPRVVIKPKIKPPKKD